MKVIELFYKIKDLDYVPKKLKYNGDIFKVSGSNYYSPSRNRYLFNETNILKMLNDEIEIIEDIPKEDKKIEKLDSRVAVKRDMVCDFDTYWNDAEDVLVNKINEIIEVINGRNI